jgi:hypothetical protein
MNVVHARSACSPGAVGQRRQRQGNFAWQQTSVISTGSHSFSLILFAASLYVHTNPCLQEKWVEFLLQDWHEILLQMAWVFSIDNRSIFFKCHEYFSNWPKGLSFKCHVYISIDKDDFFFKCKSILIKLTSGVFFYRISGVVFPQMSCVF